VKEPNPGLKSRRSRFLASIKAVVDGIGRTGGGRFSKVLTSMVSFG